jgi:maleylacetoacetate isomerase
MKLFTYFRSSAAYRVRIALGLKRIDYEPIFVPLRDRAHRAADYLALNPQGLVPMLIDGPHVLTQSLAIIEYLEETRPEPALLPADPGERAAVRAAAQAIACDIHPLNNLRVLQYLKDPLRIGEERRNTWYRHWVDTGLQALEQTLARRGGRHLFSFGDQPGLADAMLVPQLYNARRFEVDLTPYPTLTRIDDACRDLAAFADAAPEAQPDAG